MLFKLIGYKNISKGLKIFRGGVEFTSEGDGVLVADIDATEDQIHTLVNGYEAEIVKVETKARVSKAKKKNNL